MDKIILQDLTFYAYHGVLKEENKLGQNFIIDLELFCDLKKAGKTDELEDSINYVLVYQLVKEICLDRQYKLIEKLAEEIAKKVLNNFSQIKEIMVRVKKPEAPIAGVFNFVAVEIRRKQDE